MDWAPWDVSTADTGDQFDPTHNLSNKSFSSLAAMVLPSWGAAGTEGGVLLGTLRRHGGKGADGVGLQPL